MNVIFRISSLGFGGAEQVFISIAESLRNEHKIGITFIVDRDNGQSVAAVRAKGFNVISLNVTRTINSIMAFKRILEKLKPDVVLSAYPDTNGAALLSRMISTHKCPIIVSEHASIAKHWAVYPKHWQLRVKLIVKYLYRLSNSIVCVSNGLRNEVQALVGGSTDVVTIYNPVRFKNEVVRVKDKNQSVILAVGRISIPKDYTTLIRAFSLVQDKKSILKIVGGIYDKDEFNKISNLVTELNLTQRIQFVGYTSEPEKYYQVADVFVLSSAWEGFGNVIVEALAFGLPIVSTNCESGPAEILENGKYGRLVPVGDYQALAREIDLILNDNPYESSKQISRAKDFSEQAIGLKYYELINSLAVK